MREISVEPESAEGEYHLKMHWLEGRDDNPETDLTFDLSCQAGLGGRYLILTVKNEGVRTVEKIDVGTIVNQWVNNIVRKETEDASA